MSLPPATQHVYDSVLSSELLDFGSPSLLPRPKRLENLVRYSARLPSSWPVPPQISCSFPIYLYYRALRALGQHVSATDLRYIMGVIHNKSLTYSSEFRDDFFRQCLKKISAYSFPKVFSDGPKWMLFVHLHHLTGKAPYDKDKLKQQIKVWASPNRPDGKPKLFDPQSVSTGLDTVFNGWLADPDATLSFDQYADDFMRWGTSGGAPKSTYDGETYRTKWAWAFSHSTSPDGDLLPAPELYSKSLSYPNVAKVALKEQPDKTRVVITTPMPSYLRQSFLLYKRKTPPIASPAYNKSWSRTFEARSFPWMGCIDGDSFDQCVPADFVIEVIRRLGDLDDETRRVAAEEIESLRRLTVEWGDLSVPWRGGVLSGWKLTSILGSLASHCAVTHIQRMSSYGTQIQHGVLGDDVILYSDTATLTAEELVQHYSDFGLIANLSKTTSGPVGEFLRKTVSSGGSWGYPALSFRSIVFASPWVSNYDFEKEDELASVHLTLLSRLLPHRAAPGIERFSEALFVHNLSTRFGPGQWADWYHTPISAGGGGPSELSVPSRWTQIRRFSKTDRFTSKKTLVPALVGILKKRLLFEPVARFTPVDFRLVTKDYLNLLQNTTAPPPLLFKKSANITRTIYAFLFDRMSRSQLSQALVFPLPRSVRAMDPVDIVSALLTTSSPSAACSSITHTKEVISGVKSLTDFISKCIASSPRFSRPYTYKPLITYYFMVTYKNLSLPYGTW